MKGDLQVGQLLVRLVQKVGQYGPQDGLVAHNEDVFLPLHLHDDWFQTQHQIRIRLSASISEMKLVLITEGKVFGMGGGNLFVGETITDPSIEFVKGLPVETRIGKLGGCLDGALKGACPHGQRIVAVELSQDGGQGMGKLPSTICQGGIATYPSALIVRRLSMLLGTPRHEAREEGEGIPER